MFSSPPTHTTTAPKILTIQGRALRYFTGHPPTQATYVAPDNSVGVATLRQAARPRPKQCPKADPVPGADRSAIGKWAAVALAGLSAGPAPGRAGPAGIWLNGRCCPKTPSPLGEAYAHLPESVSLLRSVHGRRTALAGARQWMGSGVSITTRVRACPPTAGRRGHLHIRHRV